MWPIIFDSLPLKMFFSIFFTGITIKMMDDFIDEDFDHLIGIFNLTKELGPGIVSYILLIFSLAIVLNPKVATSLFFVSFSIGMVGNLTAKMPSGLYGYQESIIVLILALFLSGTKEVFSSLFLITAIQLWDDYLDYTGDKYSSKNWAFILGKTECFILGLLNFLASLYLDYIKAILGIISAILIVYIINILSIKVIKEKAETKEVQYNDDI